MVAFFSRWRAAARGAVPSPLVPRLDWKAPAFPPSHLSPASHLVHSSSSCVERHRTKRSTQIVHPARSCGRKTGYGILHSAALANGARKEKNSAAQNQSIRIVRGLEVSKKICARRRLRKSCANSACYQPPSHSSSLQHRCKSVQVGAAVAR